MIKEIAENSLMSAFYQMIPYFKYFMGEDAGITMSNTEEYLFVQNTDKLKINFRAGDKLPPNCAADVCLKKKEVIDVIIPKEVFGFPVRTIAIPVFDEMGEIAGTMVVSASIDKINRLTELTGSVSEALTAINQKTKEMQEGFVQINKENEKIAVSLEQTKEDYKRTDDIFGFVNSVIRQTNFLGLNASIEAARAGQAGQGFAVVASKITSLSNSTKKSLIEIDEVLGTIQTSIADILARVQSSNELLEQQIKGVDSIETAIETINENVKMLDEMAKKL